MRKCQAETNVKCGTIGVQIGQEYQKQINFLHNSYQISRHKNGQLSVDTSTHGRVNRNTSASTDKELPPPYSDELQPSGIKASDIPQWRWTNKQCREWITAVFIEYGSLERKDAETRAEKFEGFGPTLCARDSDFWQKQYGPLGHSIHCLITENYWKEGAVPHGWKWKNEV